MINARIMDGDVLFIKKMDTVNNGDIAAVLIDDEATLKRFYYYEDTQTVQLVAENPAYRPIVPTGPEASGVRIMGKAVAFRSDIE